ncbi:MAG: Xaa-Pro dipeptidase [Gammaproteobacteria bacterium]|nr:Xaa-Pro dipeptidase [Gammaproteobacteria bacterium]
MQAAARLYRPHIEVLSTRYDTALDSTGFDAVLIGAGVPVLVHRDDQDYPYRPEPLFLQWAPLAAHPGSALLYRPGRKPLLLVLEPDDFWHQPAPVPPGPWSKALEVRVIRHRDDIAKHLPAGKTRLAVLGAPLQWRGMALPGRLNPKPLLTHLDYERACKTPWEVACIQVATALGLAGHRAVRQAFAAGCSEYEMGLIFLAACGQTDAELPYPAIVAQNRNAATLHYQHRDRQRLPPRERHSLLLDAGCTHRGYASDITRTHAARPGEFAGMVRDMDRAQQRLCGLVRPGVAFPELQLAAQQEIAGLLARWELVRMTPEDMVARRVTDAFLPHGLGHLLGLQVHDVGGGLASRRGGELARPARFPRLRLTRPLTTGMVVTIEPGLYFIDSLLARLRRSPVARRVNWGRVAALRRYGGIRIEDNVLVTPAGHRNLTRELESAA